MLRKWINSIGLPNLQPTITDRVCSDHFENDDVLKINDVYSLNNDSIPSIKPQNAFVLSLEDDYDKKYRSPVSKRNIDFVFNNLEFNKLEENTLIVKDITKEKKNESKLLNSLEKKLDVQRLKNNEKIFNTSATQSSSTKINDNKETLNKSNYGDVIDILDNTNNKQGTLSKHKKVESSIDTSIKPYEDEITKEKKIKNENSNNIDLEYVYMDVLNNKNLIEEQPTIDTNNSVKEQNMIPKSRNNGNDCDYIYLDMLDGDDAKNVLSFEKKSISKNSKTKILKLLEKNHIDGIPESIIYNQDLIECYGEMLPPYCDQDCQLICYYSIPGVVRRQIYKEFQMLHSATEQNCKITQLVQLRMTKKRDDTFKSCPTYYFVINKESIKVCRTFFMNTLGISERRLNAILKPINYSWYSDRDTALKANQPKQVNVINEPVVMTDFMKESLIPLDKDYNLYEPESDSEVSLENVPFKEYEKVFLYMKGIPRVLSSYRMPGTLKKHFFETSICLEYMYKTYSENFIRNKTPPPYTKRQFKKIYNQYMKTFLKMV
uniref:THAP-type domain-containing protein n=1 Tax=Schizaphis graminum TaxID=13262 RepID=A0A2S2P987_SCHGA